MIPEYTHTDRHPIHRAMQHGWYVVLHCDSPDYGLRLVPIRLTVEDHRADRPLVRMVAIVPAAVRGQHQMAYSTTVDLSIPVADADPAVLLNAWPTTATVIGQLASTFCALGLIGHHAIMAMAAALVEVPLGLIPIDDAEIWPDTLSRGKWRVGTTVHNGRYIATTGSVHIDLHKRATTAPEAI